MIRYQCKNQQKFEFFKTEFEEKLDNENRWVKMAEEIPWDELASIYYRGMNKGFGSPSKSARLVIGAVIIKHKLNLSDAETIEQIRENPYLQYFVGYGEYSSGTAFDSSLFVKIRERLGKEEFAEFSQIIIEKAEAQKQKHKDIKQTKKSRKEKNKKDKSDDKPTPPQEEKKETSDETPSTEPKEKLEETKRNTHSGKLILDATVADQYIKYPTDLDLLDEAREKSEKLIDEIFPHSKLTKKPRTYRRKAHKEYLATSKKGKKTFKEIKKAVRKQLGYLGRNLRTIEHMLDNREEIEFPLNHKHQKLYWIIQQFYSQQKEMYDNKTNKCKDRIVSLHQAHVRPMVRGKAKNKTEFGAKLGVGLCEGYATISKISWDAYDEGSDLVKQVEEYKTMYGYYPEVVIADTKYGTKNNRKSLKDLGIRYSGTSLGRKPKETEENKEILKAKKQQRQQESGIRNQIEGKFGQGKNGYNLNRIRTRKMSTSESSICAIFFVMNIIQFMKDNIFVLILKMRNLVKFLKINIADWNVIIFKPELSLLFQ